MKSRQYVILLTACVNPSGMAFTALTDSDERLRQYRDALDFYLHHSSLPVVFCENTGYDFSVHYRPYVEQGRLECLTFDGNRFDKTKGKGYGEALNMEYALSHSRFLAEATMLVKVTGRLKVLNIEELVEGNRRVKGAIQALYPHHGMMDSRVVIAPIRFFRLEFLPTKNEINDSQGFYFEHLLLQTVTDSMHCLYLPFLYVPQIVGVSGTSGQTYAPAPSQRMPAAFMNDMLGNALRFDALRPCHRLTLLQRMRIFLQRIICKLRVSRYISR